MGNNRQQTLRMRKQLGMMPPKKRKYSDDFQTPEYAVGPLVPYLRARNFSVVWEPAAGEGYLVRALRAAGFAVISSDIRENKDFLSYVPDVEWDVIVTNPPYSLRYEFIERCYKLGKPWAMLMTLTTLEGRRQRLFREHGVELLLLDKRINFITPYRKDGSAWFPVAWFCHRILPQQICYGNVVNKDAIASGE